MALATPCPACDHLNDASARYCVSCGVAVAGGRSCRTCGASIAAAAKFCTACGSRVQESEIPPGPGSVLGGVWDKADGEIVRRVSEREMRGRLFNDSSDAGSNGSGGFWSTLANLGRSVLAQVQGRTVQVPSGCIAAVVVEGRVEQILPPGTQTTIAFFQKLRGGGQLERTSFYLVDRRPVPVHFQYDVPGQTEGHTTALAIIVTAHVVGGSEQAACDGLTTFIDRMVADRDSLNAEVVHQRLFPHVERLVKDGARRFQSDTGVDLAKLEAFLREHLATDFGNAHGLHFDVLAAPRGTVVGLNLHLGQAALPDIRTCVTDGCGGEIKFGQRFCTRCGGAQPTPIRPDRTCAKADCGKPVPMGAETCPACGTPFTGDDPRLLRLITSDSQQLELDLVLRAQGDRELTDTTRIAAAIATATARLVRGKTYQELVTPQGFEAIEVGMRQTAIDALQGLNLRLLDLTVLDCKSRNGEWETNARAEITQARSELAVGREWLDVDGANIDLETSTLELVLRREKMQRDTDFDRRKVALEHALRMDEADLSDRETRQGHLDRGATLDLTEAQRDSTRTIGVTDAQRAATRHLRDQDHVDLQTEIGQQQDIENLSDAQRRTRESGELEHQVALEDTTATHEDSLARQSLKLDSDRNRFAADDEDYSGRKVLDRDVDRLSRTQDVELTGTRQRMEIDQDARDRDAARDLEELKIAQDIQLRHQAAEAEAQQQRLARLKDMSTDQIMASVSHERALTDAEAAALAEAAVGGNRQATEAMERLMAEKDVHHAQVERLRERSSDQVAAMFQQFMADQRAAQDRTLEAVNRNVEAMAGANRGVQEQAIAAHRGAADQARAMSERSMDAMAKVAASAARGPQQVVHATPGSPVVPPPEPSAADASQDPAEDSPAITASGAIICKSCSATMVATDGFCPACGARRA